MPTNRFMIPIVLSLMLSLSLMFANVSLASSQPSYAKWGRIAMKEAQHKYQAPITDYLHVGRTTISSTQAEETFKLLMTKEGRPSAVFVTIRFNSVTESLVSVRYKETTP
ncbi:DUF3889 domain-containing protein [Paenibacillus pini]|uniref:DUF3889 domain-containing protein n=1 Tax=Paenibacillus pini JCM 16418 TaxID=1236976 RepID=W7YTA3_9BACL|nr:DUF3889 domain-containing protein [Paenibacillus pini]GAF07856.1 hypothetical protein JCM16418_1888 [Paenibacillus pini JCM 16418]